VTGDRPGLAVVAPCRNEQPVLPECLRRTPGHRRALSAGRAAAFDRLPTWLADVEIPRATGDFRLIARPIADLPCRMPEHHRFVRGMIAWVGGRQAPLLHDRAARSAGTSKDPLRRGALRFSPPGAPGASVGRRDEDGRGRPLFLEAGRVGRGLPGTAHTDAAPGYPPIGKDLHT